ncbi:MAG: type IV pilus twitching motility protein PilT [Vulcanimicrobiota bacterium]
MSIFGLLYQAHQRKASDLHLVVGLPVTLRLHGQIEPLGSSLLDEPQVRALLAEAIGDQEMARLEHEKEIDAGITVPDTGRCRVAAFYQKGSLSASFRLVPTELPSPGKLGLPAAVGYFSRLQNGLVLITGVTGSGKSTTMSIIVDQINRDRRSRIITIEDPVEYLHTSKRSVVLQREVRLDTDSYGKALRGVLRQDPDVIVIGEMRDHDTVSVALTAAETGHLVVSTLHTKTATETIQRVIDTYPANQQSQVRSQLADTLQGVICQRLIPNQQGNGVALAFEVLVVNRPIRTMIREGRLEQIPNALLTAKEAGCCPLDHCLRYLLDQGKIDYDAAISHCHDPESFDMLTGVGAPMLFTV